MLQHKLFHTKDRLFKIFSKSECQSYLDSGAKIRIISTCNLEIIAHGHWFADTN